MRSIRRKVEIIGIYSDKKELPGKKKFFRMNKNALHNDIYMLDNNPSYQGNRD